MSARHALIAAAAALALIGSAGARPPPDPPQVLVLHSYHRGFTWTDQQMDGILAVFRERWPSFEPHTAYLDAKRHDGPDHEAALLALLRAGRPDRPWDAVIATDDAALSFLLRHRAEVGGDAPVAFSGVNGLDLQRLGPATQAPRLSGVIEAVDVAGTLALVRALQPRLRSLTVLLDRTDTSAALDGRVREELARLPVSFPARIAADLSMEEAEALVAGLGPDDAVLLGSFVRDRLGAVHSYEEVATRLSARSGAPVYGVWEFQLGQGIVGGSLLSGERQGRRAAEIAIALAEGQDVPLDQGLAPFLAVDVRAAARFGLEPAGLGPDVAVVNAPRTVWSAYRRELTGAAAAFAALLALTAFLLATNRRLALARRALAESEERHRSIVDSVSDAIFVHDPATGVIVDVNARACELYGFPRSELVGRDVGQLSMGEPPFAPEDALRWLERARAEGPQLFEWQARDREGRRFWVEVAARIAAIGGSERAIVTVRDVGDRRRAEEERRLLRQRFEETQRLEAVGRLAGGIAHDLNNLLTPILVCAGLVREQLGPGHPAAEDVETIRGSAERARDLTGQVLAFSRRQRLELRVLDLDAELRALRAMLPRLVGADVELRLALAPGPLPIRGDPAQLQQVLMNLVVNARDATPGGGTIEIATGIRPGAVVLSVRDTGCGLSEEARLHLFEPFFTTKPIGKGTGLGLSTVHGIVKQHGGEVEVESAPGAGCTFRVVLPRAAEAPPAERPAPAASPAGTGVLLLVEDEPHVRQVARRVLGGAGFTVVEAADGASALEAAARLDRIDLVLTDVVMPGLTGRELCERLLVTRPDLPVLYMSGYPAQPGSGEELVDGATDAFLPKPFTPAELLAKVHEALRLAAERRAGAAPP